MGRLFHDLEFSALPRQSQPGLLSSEFQKAGGFLSQKYKYYETFLAPYEFDHVIERLTKDNPNVDVQILLGSLYDGERFDYKVITVRAAQVTDKHILVTGMQHAREFSVLPTLLYTLGEILAGNVSLKHNLVLIPLLNSAGYQKAIFHDATHRNTTNNVDLNRSWPQGHKVRNFGAAAPPLQPVETTSLLQFLARLPGKIEASLDIHSYGGVILKGCAHSADCNEISSSILRREDELAHTLKMHMRASSLFASAEYQIRAQSDFIFVSDPYKGEGLLSDYLHHQFGIPSLSVELCPFLKNPDSRERDFKKFRGGTAQELRCTRLAFLKGLIALDRTL